MLNILNNYYHLDVTEEILKNIEEQLHLTYDKDNISLFENTDDSYLQEELKKLLSDRKDSDIKILNEEELEDYKLIITCIIRDLNEYIKDDKKLILFIAKLFISETSVDYAIKNLELSKKEKNKVEKIIEGYKDMFRYWNNFGYTIDEIDRQNFIDKPLNSPKESSLLYLLKALPEKLYKKINENYTENNIEPENLVNLIIARTKLKIESYDYQILSEYLDLDNKELTDFVDAFDLKNGIFFLYKDKSKIKCIIPNEIKEIIKSALDKNSFTQDLDIIKTNLVESYLEMNGIIEKTKLQSILKEFHDLDISIKELDKIVKNNEGLILKEKYYSFINDLDDETIDLLSELKDFYGEYKKIDIESYIEEMNWREELKELLDKFVKHKSKEVLYIGIVTFTKNGKFNKDILNMMLEDLNISFNKKSFDQIMNLYNNYKKYISLWIYNGFSITEFNNKPKKEKIGRNDPCPCGSGKKYKNCCGK